MSKERSSTSDGIGFTGLLTIAFIVLKLCNVISWSWWWVLSPLWIPIGLIIAGFIIWLLWQVLYKMPDEKRRIKAGMNEWAWKRRNKQKLTFIPKNKWEERIEEMQKIKNNLQK